MIPGERHNEYKIHLKALPEQIFVMFLQIDKSSTRKERFHSDSATWSCLSECHCELSPKLFPYDEVSCMQTGTLDTEIIWDAEITTQ